MNKVLKIYCIIPVYNAAKYLRECVDSVLHQTYKNVEIILVNDCSTDNSQEICREYVAQHPEKVSLVDKKVNQGEGWARYSGIEYVKNKIGDSSEATLFFIDSDDYLQKDAFIRLSDEMLATDADVVEMKMRRVWGPIKMKGLQGEQARFISADELRAKYYLSFYGINLLSVSACGKLFKAKPVFAADIIPYKLKLGEDLLFSMRIFPHLRGYSIIDYYGYNYRIGGVTSNYNPAMWECLKQQFHIKKEFAEQQDFVNYERTLNIELKNCFISAVMERLEYLYESDEELRKWITDEIQQNDIWSGFLPLTKSEKDGIYQDILNCNANAVIERARQIMHANRWRYRAKRVLKHIIK